MESKFVLMLGSLKKSSYSINITKVFLFLFVSIVFSGCTTIKLDYSVVSVPEEGTIRLMQYTFEEDNVVFPYIRHSVVAGGTRDLVWYAPSLLAIDPKGEKITYLARLNDFNNIYIRDIKGGRATIQRTFNRDVYDMSYSPNGENIVFTSRRNNIDDDIFMIKANGGASIQQIVSTTASELSPTFTSDGNKVFFVRSEGSRYFIWSIDINSSITTQYTEGFTPCLYDKDTKMLVTRNSKDGNRGEIWSIDLESGTETLILNHPKKGYSSPKISPKGDKIICVGSTEKDKNKNSNLDLYLVNLDGTQLTQLTFHGGHDVSPIWHPDGQSIFFLSQRGNRKGEANVWKMELNKSMLQ